MLPAHMHVHVNRAAQDLAMLPAHMHVHVNRAAQDLVMLPGHMHVHVNRAAETLDAACYSSASYSRLVLVWPEERFN